MKDDFLTTRRSHDTTPSPPTTTQIMANIQQQSPCQIVFGCKRKNRFLKRLNVEIVLRSCCCCLEPYLSVLNFFFCWDSVLCAEKLPLLHSEWLPWYLWTVESRNGQLRWSLSSFNSSIIWIISRWCVAKELKVGQTTKVEKRWGASVKVSSD